MVLRIGSLRLKDMGRPRIRPGVRFDGARQLRAELCRRRDTEVCSRHWPRHRFQRNRGGGSLVVVTNQRWAEDAVRPAAPVYVSEGLQSLAVALAGQLFSFCPSVCPAARARNTIA